jgi:pyruvate dehydrogenase E1 component beta subunit
MARELKYYQAIHEALDQYLAKDPSVYVMGLGVSDPKGVFGTTLGLQEKYGISRVMDMPVSENGMTGIAIGSALMGLRPVMVHQRIDFALLAMEQIVNQAAKWHYMFGGLMRVPMVIRVVVGRGWGQGPQHSQSLQAFFAHVPGLKVVMPVTPYDAKGLLVASIEDENPVVFIEHRWLHGTFGPVPQELYRVSLGTARMARRGKDITIAATSHMVLEALRAAEVLARGAIDAEVIDVRSLKPLDGASIVESVRKTGHLIAADTGWKTCGFAGELVSLVAEEAFDRLRQPPRRIALPDCPTPTSALLCEDYYPRSVHIARAAIEMLGRRFDERLIQDREEVPLDIPDSSFSGPF